MLACSCRLLSKSLRISIRNYSVQIDQQLLKSLSRSTTADSLLVTSQHVADAYKSDEKGAKRQTLISIAEHCGVDKKAVESAINLYQQSPSKAHELHAATTPMHYRLLQSVGNLPNGVQTVCDMRATLLDMIRSEENKTIVASLRRLEESARELLTCWFCLSHLQLERLTWQSPGDILHKVAEYEAVHPIRGLIDFKKRVGLHRRCYYFSHAALPREPLVMVHVAILDTIANSVQDIVNSNKNEADENKSTTAIYYSITSTQKGLAGIDLGNMLIKRVASEIQSSLPSVKVHSTLSPIPGFRSWLIRNLHGHDSDGSVCDDYVVGGLSKTAGRKLSKEEAGELLLQVVSNRTAADQLEPLRDVLMHICAKYLYTTKRGGFAINPVANFHLRNGAELYRLNWKGDTSMRGIQNSLGMMVNYRYRLENVHRNSALYTEKKEIVVDQQVLDLMK